jgi:hypothetical protein
LRGPETGGFKDAFSIKNHNLKVFFHDGECVPEKEPG